MTPVSVQQGVSEQALAGSPLKSVAEIDHSRLQSLSAALAEAMGKFDPDRTRHAALEAVGQGAAG
jgi:arylsulfatase